jgi:hypothetical protein
MIRLTPGGDILGSCAGHDNRLRSRAVLFKTTSIVFGGRGLIFKCLADIFLVATAYSARGSGGANS